MSTLVDRRHPGADLEEPGRGLVSRIAVPFSVFALVASAALVAWLWRHPGVFEPTPDLAYGFTERPVGQVTYVGLGSPADVAGHHTIQVDRLEPTVVANTSEARVSFFVCEIDPASPLATVGAVHDLKQPCSSLAAAAPGVPFTTGAHPAQQLVMSVEPLKPGRVEISGVELGYSKGWQEGTEWFGTRLVVETSAATRR